MKTAYQQKKKAFRDGICIQATTAAHLFEPATSRLLSPSIPQAQFDAMAKSMTTPNPKGRVVKPTKLEVTAAKTGPLAEGDIAINVQVWP